MNFEEFKERYEHKKVEEYPNSVEDNPIVSVCVMTYQHVDYIKDCLDGVLMQKTDFPIEILLGEDDSTDSTREICLEYAKKHPDKIRLFLHHRENNIVINGTPTGRFNLLYNLYSAKGKYIALCEGDDYWINPRKLQKQVDFLNANQDCSLCGHHTKVIFEDESKPEVIWGPKDFSKSHKYSLTDMLEDKLPHPHLQSVMFRISVVEDIPDWTFEASFGDWVIRLLCAYNGKIGFIPGVMGVYRKNAIVSWSSNNRNIEWHRKRIDNRIKVYELFNEYSNFKFNKEIKKANKRWIKNCILQALNIFPARKVSKLIKENFRLFLDPRKKRNVRIWGVLILGEERYSTLSNFYNSKFRKA